MKVFEVIQPSPQFLYHGSSRDRILSILQYGLDPAKNILSGHSIGLTPKPHIYLTADPVDAKLYGDFVLQIDISKIDASKLGPDDDDLQDILDQRRDARSWEEFSWIESLKISGQCTYLGIIPPDAITEVPT